MSVDSTNSEIDIISMNSGSCVLTSLNIGLPSDLSELNLPSNRDILKYYLFLRVAVQKKKKKKQSYGSLTTQVAKKILDIWNKLNIPLINEKTVFKKLKTLANKYRNEIKFKSTPGKSSTFLETIDKVFYIGKCQ